MIDTTLSVCPKSSLIDPCSCILDQIDCRVTNKDIDLVQIFQTLGKQLPKTGKHFKSFELSNSSITELKENTFSDITFDTIFIHYSPKLRSIHRNAFNGTDQVTKLLTIADNPILTSPDNSIFDVLSKFINAQSIQIFRNNITEIPSNAFKSNQDQMFNLELNGETIKMLGNNSFSKMKSLTTLSIWNTSISNIPENAFEFIEKSNKTFVLYFGDNKYLNSSEFHEKSLTKFNRPALIYLFDFRYMNERVLSPFFALNDKNKVEFRYQMIDCSDCRNYWMQKNFNMLKTKIMNDRCSNGKHLNDTANFANCKS